MRVLNENDFVTACLPDLLKTANGQRTRMLMATYNSVADTQDGPYESGKHGLEVMISSGRMQYDPMVTLGFMVSMADPFGRIGEIASRQASHAMRVGGAAAQRRVTSETAVLLSQEPDKHLIATVYAGISGFEGAIDCISTIRSQFPQAQIIAVSCDCNEPIQFEPYRRSINYLVFTPHCGGRQAMRKILDQIVAAWPA